MAQDYNCQKSANEWDKRSKTNINVLRIRTPAFGSEGLAYNDAHGQRAPV